MVFWSRQEKKCLLLLLLRSPSSSILQVDMQKGGGRDTSPHQSSRHTTNPPTYYALRHSRLHDSRRRSGHRIFHHPLSLSFNRDTIPTGERGKSDGNTEGGILCISFRQQACIFHFQPCSLFLSSSSSSSFLGPFLPYPCLLHQSRDSTIQAFGCSSPVYDGVELRPS
ncbi:hypothetical protein B0J15DRAFT_52208 [Fusarium solani]|uniref:Secreted protein n=1 Tax=Fusarium solani TaxID=169388 RepID=A0A9P9KDS4_FUSSL|nr:uncharacterized protein B0J15DRAFT_52208 [Fusarium solani]KAH7249299.1 hypothetical protein B0J15DRAFT_52208 [Fusarium solani]